MMAGTGILCRIQVFVLHLAARCALSRIDKNDVVRLGNVGGKLRHKLVTSQDFNPIITGMYLSDGLRHSPSDSIIAS